MTTIIKRLLKILSSVGEGARQNEEYRRYLATEYRTTQDDNSCCNTNFYRLRG